MAIAALLSIACTTDRAAPSSQAGVAPALQVDSAWARAVDSGFTGGAYVTITNHDTIDHSLTGVSSTDADAAELHQTTQHEGMVHMLATPEVVITRDSTLRMGPGGRHVMLSGMHASRRTGDTIHLVFHFADGPALPVAVPVRSP